MGLRSQSSRRRTLERIGAAMGVVWLAGCTEGGGPEADETPTQSSAIDPGTAIEFRAATSAWVGIAPESIDGEENPTITLQSGENYEIGWTEGDGAAHNIEIWNENEEVVNGLQTEIVTEPESQWLQFEANDQMAYYVCQPHQTSMIGEISIE